MSSFGIPGSKMAPNILMKKACAFASAARVDLPHGSSAFNEEVVNVNHAVVERRGQHAVEIGLVALVLVFGLLCHAAVAGDV